MITDAVAVVSPGSGCAATVFHHREKAKVLDWFKVQRAR
jgi:hypothetical protein